MNHRDNYGNNYYGDQYNDQYDGSRGEISNIDRTVTCFQIFLGLLSFYGCIQVFYVNCSYCYKEYAKRKRIKYRKIKTGELIERECSICLEDYQSGESVSSLACDHLFHKKCLEEWLKHKNECPLCRTEL
jgi:hypothetical protein